MVQQDHAPVVVLAWLLRGPRNSSLLTHCLIRGSARNKHPCGLKRNTNTPQKEEPEAEDTQ